MNVTQIILTKCQMFHFKCTKFNFGWGSAPNPAGELTALPRPPSWIWGCGIEKGGGRVREVKRRGMGKRDGNCLLYTSPSPRD